MMKRREKVRPPDQFGVRFGTILFYGLDYVFDADHLRQYWAIAVRPKTNLNPASVPDAENKR